MPRAHTLPPVLYELSCVGRDALASLPPPSQAHFDAGLTRVGFLHAQMEDATTLPIAQTASGWSSLPGWKRYNRRQRYFRVPGFCYARIFADEWLIPAICTLGAYPDASDVARLSAYFRDNSYIFATFLSGSYRRGSPVAHIRGTNKVLRTPACDRLRALSGSLVGAAHPGNNNNFPPLPPRFNALGLGPRAGVPSNNAHPSLPAIPRFAVPSGVRNARHSTPTPTGVNFKGKKPARPPARNDAPFSAPRASNKPYNRPPPLATFLTPSPSRVPRMMPSTA